MLPAIPQFWVAIVRHITTLMLALTGSAILLVPDRIRPLLSPEGQKILDQWNVLPISYSNLALLALLVGFVLACFFAWEEEHDEAQEQRAEKERLEELRGKPDYEAQIISYSGIKLEGPLGRHR